MGRPRIHDPFQQRVVVAICDARGAVRTIRTGVANGFDIGKVRLTLKDGSTAVLLTPVLPGKAACAYAKFARGQLALDLPVTPYDKWNPLNRSHVARKKARQVLQHSPEDRNGLWCFASGRLIPAL